MLGGSMSFRSPLLPSSRAFRMDNALASNAYEEPLRSVSVMDSYTLGSDRFKATLFSEKESAHPQNGYISQLQNQLPRYRATPFGGHPVADQKSQQDENHSPLHHHVPLYHSDFTSPQPSFLSNANQRSSLQTFSNPYLFNQLQPPNLASHPNVFYDSQFFWLGLYFTFNLGLTLFNKGVLVRFPFPYTLTALHALCGSIGGYVLLENGVFTPARLGTRETAALVAFSILYAINIVVSNMSLQLVTVPFHQVVRALTPIFTIVLSTSMFGTSNSPAKILSLVPVMIGVALATYGDYYFTVWGLLLTLLGTFLAALKTIYTNILQSRTVVSHRAFFSSFMPPRLQLHPLDLLTRMAPLAFIQCIFYAYASGELNLVRHYSAHEMTPFKLAALFVNGAIAFGLNIVSFTANKKAGALSMTVAGNVKQVLTILFAVTIFDLTISKMNALGILLTLLGGAWYAVVDYHEKQDSRRRG